MKQKIKRIYGVLEKQFRKHFQDSQKKKGVLGDVLMARLESRLDNVVHRMGFAPNRNSARQLVTHGHFLVNGRKVDIASFVVRVGDVVELREASRNIGIINDNNSKMEHRGIHRVA